MKNIFRNRIFGFNIIQNDFNNFSDFNKFRPYTFDLPDLNKNDYRFL